MARLNIPDEPTFQTFPVTTAQSVFPFTFAVFTKADLNVTVDGAPLGQADFTLSGTILENGGYQGGTVTLNAAVAGVEVVIYRDVTPARASQFSPANTVPVGSVDQALNRLTANMQDIGRDVRRGILSPVSEPGIVLPPSADRPGNGLFFDDEDRPFWGLPFAGGPISSFFQNLIQAATAPVALFLLGIKTPGGYGAVGNGIVDDTAAMIAAGASGGEVWLQGKTYKVSNKITLASGTIFKGPGKLVPTVGFAGQWVIEVAAGAGTQVKDITIDGAAILPANIVYGIRANGSTTDLLIAGCTVKNLTFTGIDVSGGGGSLTHARLRVSDNRIDNVGWIGIQVENSVAAKVRGNDVTRTGYHGIATNKGCDDAVVSENYVSKALAPTSVFNGLPGGVEGGFMITYEPTVERLVISGNVLNDNRTAAFDGIGVGEDGTEFGSVVITNNIIHRAGLFGIDPTGNAVVDGNMITEAAEQGIHVGLDLGGIIRNVAVTNNVIRNTGDVAGKSGILVGDTLGNAVTMSNIKIADNVVVDERATKFTAYGITIVSEEATFTGLSVTGNDLANVATSSFSYVGAAGPGADYQCWGNATKGDELRTMTPILTPGSGAITTSTATCRYQRMGDMVDFSMRIQISAKGSGLGALTASLPVPARAGVSVPITGLSGSPADNIYGLLSSGGLVIAQDDGGATVIADGADMFLQGRYEAA